MTKLQLVNEVLRETGLSQGVDTLVDVDPASDVGKVSAFASKARLDVSRKLPVSTLKKDGAITLLARVDLADQFEDADADGEIDNALVAIEGESEISGVSDSLLQVGTGWDGRLFHIQGDRHSYRIRDANASENNMQLSDPSGALAGYTESTKSKDSDGVDKVRTDAWASTDSYPVGYLGQDRYALPADFKMPDDVNSFFSGQLEYRSPHELDHMRYTVGPYVTWGDPQWFTIRGVTLASGMPLFLFEVSPIPIVTQILHFRYEASVGRWTDQNEASGFADDYEEAVASRTRWYVYRFLKQSETDVQVEEQVWREIFTDQQKNPVTAGEPVQFQPVTYRDHWRSAYHV